MMPQQDFNGWVPIRVYWKEGDPWVDWCHFGTRAFDESFFRISVESALRDPFNQAFRRQTPIRALEEWSAARPGLTPDVFVFHASRCGSTLFAQVFAAEERNVVLSEPPPLDVLLRSPHFSPTVSDAQRQGWSRALVSALGQPRRGGETGYVIKTDAWNIFDYPTVAAAFPEVKSVFLYRDPVEILVSHMRQRGAFMIPGVITPGTFGLAPAEALAMPPEEYCARVLGHIYEAALRHFDPERMLLINYRELPEAIWTDASDFIGLDIPARVRDKMRQASAFDAKNPSAHFSADSARKQEQAHPRLRDMAARWVVPHYEALEAARLRSRTDAR